MTRFHLFLDNIQGCIWRGVRGFDPPQEVADTPESSAEPLWGVDYNPLRLPQASPDSIFLLNQYNYVINSVTFFCVIIPISGNNRYPVPVHCMNKLWYIAVISLLSHLFFFCYFFMLTPL